MLFLARDGMLVFRLEGDTDQSRCAITTDKVIKTITNQDADRRMANVVIEAYASGRELYVRGSDDCVPVRGSGSASVHLELVEIVRRADRRPGKKKK